jgi:ubiquinone/menaquinone biosynthesis C-methylase UbiE
MIFILHDINGEELSQAQTYRNNSVIQTSSAEIFLEKWELQGDERILDIGCGDGRITSLISQKVPLGSVKGIDCSRSMIDLAKSSFSHISFEQVDALNFEDKEKYDVIVCLSTLHWFVDQKAIFKRMKGLLKQDGRIFILAYSPVNAYWKPIEAGVLSGKWDHFYERKPFYCQLHKDFLKAEIEADSFSILSFNSIPAIATFKGKNGFINHVRGFLPHLAFLPENFHEELLDDIGTSFLLCNELDLNGAIHQDYEVYELILRPTSS